MPVRSAGMEVKMKIIQLLPTLSYGDGVGNDTLAIDKIIKEMGYATKIYAENIDSRIKKGLAEKVEKMPRIASDDIIIYHLSTGTPLNDRIMDFHCKKLIVYHNITPAHFFKNYSRISFDLCESGRAAVAKLHHTADYCWAVSSYNRQELLECGYPCKIDIVPIVVPFEDYSGEPDKAVLKRYSDDWVNIVFVGRISPNKKQEDLIKTFYYYKNYINPKSRLFLVGSYNGTERYYDRLCRYIEELNLGDVHITGHIKFQEILSYYHLADIFLCMSEHEGFCIPLLEAMYFEIPIVAYAYTGVAETLAYAGLKFTEKDCKAAAEMMHMILTKDELRKKIIEQQNNRLQDFTYEKTKEKIVSYLKGFIG